MLARELEVAEDIHAAFAEDLPVRYSGAGLVDAPVSAVKSDEGAPDFQGAGNTARKVSFEILQSAFPEEPRIGNVLIEADGAGQAWRVNDRTRRDDAGTWMFIVEKVS